MAKTKYKSYSEFAAVYGNIGITEWIKYNYLANYTPVLPGTKKYIIKTNTTPVSAVRVIAGIRATTGLGLNEAKNACLDIYGKSSGDLTEILRLVTEVTGSEENRPYVGVFGAYDTKAEADAVLESIAASSRIYFEVVEIIE